jgi:hypothetical protein
MGLIRQFTMHAYSPGAKQRRQTYLVWSFWTMMAMVGQVSSVAAAEQPPNSKALQASRL